MSYLLWGGGKSAALPALLCPMLFVVPPANPYWCGRSDELPVAVSHLMGSKSCFSDWLA